MFAQGCDGEMGRVADPMPLAAFCCVWCSRNAGNVDRQGWQMGAGHCVNTSTASTVQVEERVHLGGRVGHEALRGVHVQVHGVQDGRVQALRRHGGRGAATVPSMTQLNKAASQK